MAFSRRNKPKVDAFLSLIQTKSIETFRSICSVNKITNEGSFCYRQMHARKRNLRRFNCLKFPKCGVRNQIYSNLDQPSGRLVCILLGFIEQCVGHLRGIWFAMNHITYCLTKRNLGHVSQQGNCKHLLQKRLGSCSSVLSDGAGAYNHVSFIQYSFALQISFPRSGSREVMTHEGLEMPFCL